MKLRPAKITGHLPATVAWVIIAAATLVAPLLLSTPQVIIYVTIGLATMVVAGLSLLMGFAGQVSLGQAAFYGIGAYSAAIMAVHGWPPLLALVLAPVITAAIAGLLGIPLLRLKGHALAFGTLAVQLIMLAVLSETPSLTGGAVGLSGVPTLKIGPIALTGYRQYAYLVWVVAAIVLLVSRNITRSRPGRGLRAMATAPSAASAAGVNVVTYKLRDFALSAAYAGLAGGIYAFFLGYVSPDAFPVMLSIEYVIMVVVGGLGTVSGAFVGAAVIMVISQVLSSIGSSPSLPPQLPNVLSEGVYAVILIAVLRLMPDGIVGLSSRLAKRVGSRFGAQRGEGGQSVEADVTVVAASSTADEPDAPAREAGAKPVNR
ncbi:MAG: branched-chain amino acid ABC transporter permease [Acidimicrobiales bacterium]|jgi:branched-chain amino acid transport system permease protein|nr:branched-chain amino acid ABC transporter permease [Actinomycetota bacterium]